MSLATPGSKLNSAREAFIFPGIRARSVATLVACALLAGCGGGSGGNVSGKIAVSVTPQSITMGVGSNYHFGASVTGTTNHAVNWEVNGIGGGNAQAGTIDSSGLYIAPGTNPGGTVSVAAVAMADGTTSGSASVTLSPTDPLGTATGQTIPCPTVAGMSPGTCYSVVLSCSGIADLDGYLWVNTPAITPKGTVMLTEGANVTGLYEAIFRYGSTVVNGLLAAGYTTVQASFGGVFNPNQPFGWQTGPGGLRRTACRYATLAKWVQDNLGASGAPVCATGNSASSGLIGYALSHYGGTSIFTMVEPTSGPPFSRLDYSCECTQPSLPDPCVPGQQLTQCVELSNAQKYIDPAYSSPICSQDVQSKSTAHAAQFLSDSILSPEATLSYPNTSVHFVWGGMDLSSAPVMGKEWQQGITSPNAYACVGDAPHGLPDAQDGATQILNDLVNFCHH
jgi:hypothetical protein